MINFPKDEQVPSIAQKKLENESKKLSFMGIY